MTNTSDRELMEALKRDEPNAYTAYRKAYGDALFRYIAARTHNLQDAEEVHLEVLLKAMSTWRPDLGSLKDWLYMLARQAIATWARKNAKERDVVSLDQLIEERREPQAVELAPASRDRMAPLKTQLREFVETLPKREQDLFRLCIIEELTDFQVARLLGVKPESVKTMRCRMIRKVTAAFQGQLTKRFGD